MSSRGTGISSFTHRYCCFRREPQPLCSRLNEMAFVASVAENSLTGIDTSPNDTVNDAIDRAAMSSPWVRRKIPMIDQEDISCHSPCFYVCCAMPAPSLRHNRDFMLLWGGQVVST